MRPIRNIVVHCTATPQSTSVASIQRYWRTNLGWKNPGYHVIVKASGEAVELLPIEKVSNGVAGHNSDSVHISYIGGVDGKRAVDNRTPAQKETLLKYLRKWKSMFPAAKIKGHRDFPGVKKACPSFNAIPEYQHIQ